MKIKVILLLCFLVCNVNFGQILKDKFTYKVTYNLKFRLDSTEADPKSEVMYLYLGDKISRFSSRAKFYQDKFTIRGNSGTTSKMAKTDFPYIYYKNRSENSIINSVFIPKDEYFFEQPMQIFNWQIKADTSSIKGYHVQKAVTDFAGRTYIAWFTPDIAIADGPYKFNGLPGLILEIEDTENDYVFSFEGLEQLSPKESFKLNLKQLIKLDRAALEAEHLEYRKDPMGYMMARGEADNFEITPEVHKHYKEMFGKLLAKENNPIELR